jgi:phage shock protein PspC (stress-responsive transcriptional regulator)
MNRRLYRSRRDSVLGGVAGGVADYLDVDPAIVRIIWAVLGVVTGGFFVLLYIVMWIVVPEAPAVAPPGAASAATAATAATPGTTPADGTASGPVSAGPAWAGEQPDERRRGSGAAVIFGLILIGAGIWFLIDQYLPAIDRDVLWPIGLVVLGAALLVNSLRRPRAE